MSLVRREFLRLAAGAATIPIASQIARAIDYPTRPVHLLVGYAAGGPGDTVARLMGQWLSERLGQSFVIENRTGAGGNLATQMVVRARPDGYTLLHATISNSWNASLYSNLEFNFIRDIAPVAGISREGGVIVVTPSMPVKTIPEFIAYAKANRRKINMGSGGVGSPAYLFGELFEIKTGIELVHVPYRGGGPTVMAMLGGQVDVFFGPVTVSLQHIRSGKLRALGVTTAARMDVLPDVPPIGDFVPGYEASSWNGIGAPKDTPAEIIDKLNQEINTGLADPSFKARLANLGADALPMSASDFGKFIAHETEKWAEVIRTAGIKAE